MLINFNDGWRFAIENGGIATDFREVSLPHDWQIELPRSPENDGSQGYWPHSGAGVYEKEFAAPDEWAGRHVELRFGGSQRFSQVFLNGKLAGGHNYGYVPFEADLSGALICGGANKLTVRLDNTDPGDRWYSGMGIYRDVKLAVTEKCYIPARGLRVTSKMVGDDAVSHVELDVTNDGAPSEIYIKISLAGATAAQFVKADGANTYSFDMRITKPQVWDTDSPCVYSCRAVVSQNGAEIDNVSVNAGFRDARFDNDKGFLLNGRQLKLKGVDLHHDGGVFGAAVPNGIWRRRLEVLKSIGVNSIRCSHNPQDEEVYNLCDEMGLLVIDEVYDKWDGTDLYYKDIFPTDRLDDLTRMVHRDMSHPSVILWSVGNEVEIQYSENFYIYLKELCEKCRELDPTRGVSAALISYVLEDFNEGTDIEKRLNATLRYGELVDVFMGNYLESFYRPLRERGLKKAFVGSEILHYYRFEENSNVVNVPRMAWLDVEENEWVAGGFIWAGIDYLGESIGWPCHGWTACPIDSAGFVKTRAYHIMSRWLEKPFVRIAVYDDSRVWEMDDGMWSFPEVAEDWNQGRHRRMYHLAVFTNCEEVRLIQDGKFPRVAKPDSEEKIAHFYISWWRGSLLAEGYNEGKKVCEHRLVTTDAPASLELTPFRPRSGEVIQVEARLLDAEGQVYLRDEPVLEAKVEGDMELLKLTNGDFLATDDIPRMHNGHMLIVLKPTGEGRAKLRVSAAGLNAEIEL